MQQLDLVLQKNVQRREAMLCLTYFICVVGEDCLDWFYWSHILESLFLFLSVYVRLCFLFVWLVALSIVCPHFLGFGSSGFSLLAAAASISVCCKCCAAVLKTQFLYIFC
ncbi:hypothetical protein SADUNF_Sadunf18G0034000 [Salix dunnii]|uniref:Uncharacterized protein n=1 Tax=Salix dunnii TaxID=1413687 RepID=A0A835MG24_9ROSI|nr:hypothetical protein SADUNF_Sadunf18G0034000 [Salix dunnii]